MEDTQSETALISSTLNFDCKLEMGEMFHTNILWL